MLLRQGIKTALPDTQKQTQGGCQNEETKNMAQMKERIRTPGKKTKQNGDERFTRAQVKTLVQRVLKELSTRTA